MELVMRSCEYFRVLRLMSVDSSRRRSTNRNVQHCEQIKACDYHRLVTWSTLSGEQRSEKHTCKSPHFLNVSECRQFLWTLSTDALKYKPASRQSPESNQQRNAWNVCSFSVSLSICCRFTYGLNLLPFRFFPRLRLLFNSVLFDKRSVKHVFSTSSSPRSSLSTNKISNGFPAFFCFLFSSGRSERKEKKKKCCK